MSAKQRTGVQNSVLLVLLGSLLSASPSELYSATNKDEVRAALESRHDKVVYIKEFDHFAYLEIAARIALSGGAGLGDYAGRVLQEIATATGEKIGVDTLTEILSGQQNDDTLFGGKPIYVGFVSYNHWTMEGTKGITPIFKVPRPNTHELYVAIGRKSPPPSSAPITFGWWNPWKDPKTMWRLMPADKESHEFWIVSAPSQRVPDHMIYLNENGTLGVWPYWGDAKTKWKLVPEGRDGLFWIVSAEGQRVPNRMLYFDDNLLMSYNFWKDPQCIWRIERLPPEYGDSMTSLIKTAEQRGRSEKMLYLQR